MGVLQVGTRVEVFWPGEREWFGGRVGEGALEEGAVVIEYFDGIPARDEVFLERGPRDLGEHNGHLVRRDGGGEVTVAEVDGEPVRPLEAASGGAKAGAIGEAEGSVVCGETYAVP
ncbi:hypothetical protein CYMTET_11766 [Cymbomonas tetramitiformis]|uniref:Uncharacterized protein n=1 Tax=Cymbomonas tetramitiformis TaxID=36881 RepID=A0AAE0LCI8_9CHLO|nr:hypothetical protein CYMTET_11766 [Cymbomonas tetramitiformis]